MNKFFQTKNSIGLVTIIFMTMALVLFIPRASLAVDQPFEYDKNRRNGHWVISQHNGTD